jgi:hypothetical protein
MLVLETTIRKEEKVTKTIPMPYYCKAESYSSMEYMKVTEQGIFLAMRNITSAGKVGYAVLEFYAGSLSSIHKEKITKATEITEYEFEQALNQALDTIKAAALNTEVVS